MMESIEKLRELRDEAASKMVDNPRWVCARAEEIADEIEREISERYMELPVDADGVPIRVGDEINSLGCGVLVNSIIWDGANWYASETVASSDWFPVKHSNHVKPCTLEDVLEEFGTKVLHSGHQWGLDAQHVIAEYADEIRELMEASE